MSFGQNEFSFEKSKFGKILILVFGEISITQKWFKKFEICVENFHTKFVYQCIMLKLFLWIFKEFMGFFRIF